MVKFEKHSPCKPLQLYVKNYYLVHIPFDMNLLQTNMAWLNTFLSINCSDGQVIVKPDEKEQVDMQGVVTMGALSKPRNYLVKSRVRLIMIEFTTCGISGLLKVNGGQLLDQTIALNDILSNTDLSILPYLLSETTILSDQINIIDNFLVPFLKRYDHKDFLLASSICQSIEQSKGNLELNKLPKEYGYSERHIRRVVKTHTGLSPKKILELTRFNHLIINWMKDPNKSNWFDYFISSGYYDSSHFNRNFKKHTGFSPSKFDPNLFALQSQMMSMS